MIHVALDLIATDLNAHLQRQQGDHLPQLVLSHLADRDGALPVESENKVILLLTSFEPETHARDFPRRTRTLPNVAQRVDPLALSLHVVFAATHRHYKTALAALSSIIGYLNAKPVFDHGNTPRMPSTLGAFSLHLERLDYAELNYLWSYLGASYLPSANYTVRVVAAGQSEIQSVTPAVAAARMT